MGIARGEAKVIKAAGNMITGPFDEVIRSLMVAVYELGVTEIMVVGHEDCGMQHSTSASLKERMLARGVKPEAIAAVEGEFAKWVDAFHHRARTWKNGGRNKKQPAAAQRYYRAWPAVLPGQRQAGSYCAWLIRWRYNESNLQNFGGADGAVLCGNRFCCVRNG